MDCDKGKNDLIEDDEDHMSLEENSKVSTSNGSAKRHTPDRFAKSQLAFEQVTIPKKRKYVRKKPITEKPKLSYADYLDTNNFALDITKKLKGYGAYDFQSYTLKTTNKKSSIYDVEKMKNDELDPSQFDLTKAQREFEKELQLPSNVELNDKLEAAETPAKKKEFNPAMTKLKMQLMLKLNYTVFIPVKQLHGNQNLHYRVNQCFTLMAH